MSLSNLLVRCYECGEPVQNGDLQVTGKKYGIIGYFHPDCWAKYQSDHPMVATPDSELKDGHLTLAVGGVELGFCDYCGAAYREVCLLHTSEKSKLCRPCHKEYVKELRSVDW